MGSDVLTIGYRDLDRPGWPAGPWDDEPDWLQWPEEQTGFVCLILRSPRMGYLCGYVGVPRGAPAWGLEDREARRRGVECHGDVTYSDDRPPCEAGSSLLPPGLWWLGFHCSNASDAFPGLDGIGMGIPGMEYRALGHVRAECEGLARQLAALKKEDDP
jgi:hypothetical protein